MLICAKCGSIPAQCCCPVPSPLQQLLLDQLEDVKIWGKSDDEQVSYLQQQLIDLHQAIHNQNHLGEKDAAEDNT